VIPLDRYLSSIPGPEFAAKILRLDPSARRIALRARFRYDRRGFLRYCFPERYDLAWSPVHEAFLDDEAVGWRERTHQDKDLDIAPRGSAKTSIKSFGDLAHRIVYGLEVSILVFSTGYQLAEAIVKDLHQVFSDTSGEGGLAEIYGPFSVGGTQTRFVVQVPGGEPLGTQVAAMSFGGTVRGHKHEGRRPSLFVLDDTVNPKHLKKPEMRDKTWKFLNADILKAGFGYSQWRMVGTLQHRDDLVGRAAASPGWRTRRWKNLISWPADMALWDRARTLWANLADPDRIETARAFYAEHREAMDRGAEVLWPAGRPLFDLMCAWWENPAAFWAEDQNEPRDPTASLFDLDRLRRCRFDGRVIHTARGTEVPIEDCRVSMWLDPSEGGATSDRPAIAVLAKDPWGYRYVIEAEGTRHAPSAQHEALWRLWERHAARRPLVGMDETGTQGLLGEAFEREREDRRRMGRPWTMPIQAIKLTANKIERIASMEPDISHGWLEFDVALPGGVVEELGDFPNGATDDYLDAIEAADALFDRLNATVTWGALPARY